MKGPEGVKIGSVVQIDPDHDEVFGGCFMFVEEVREWGFTGYVRAVRAARAPGSRAYYRVPFGGCELIGGACWP